MNAVNKNCLLFILACLRRDFVAKDKRDDAGFCNLDSRDGEAPQMILFYLCGLKIICMNNIFHVVRYEIYCNGKTTILYYVVILAKHFGQDLVRGILLSFSDIKCKKKLEMGLECPKRH